MDQATPTPELVHRSVHLSGIEGVASAFAVLSMLRLPCPELLQSTPWTVNAIAMGLGSSPSQVGKLLKVMALGDLPLVRLVPGRGGGVILCRLTQKSVLEFVRLAILAGKGASALVDSTSAREFTVESFRRHELVASLPEE